MSSEFNRGNIDHYLYLIAKEYKKQNRNNPEAEIILIGGASMLLNYNFRDTTSDLDAILHASSTMKNVIDKIGEENKLSDNWLNDDFKRTKSYSPKLVECSKFYKKFCQCLTVRTVSEEYLLAMKIRSNREYKHDKSDIIGIIKEHIEKDNPLNFNVINEAYLTLYNEKIPDDFAIQLKAILNNENLEDLFYETIDEEKINQNALIIANQKYENRITDENAKIFIDKFKVTLSKEMELVREAFFAKPKEERTTIEWQGKSYRVTAFEDLYLAQCKKEGRNPDEEIIKHFNNVVAAGNYIPQFVNNDFGTK